MELNFACKKFPIDQVLRCAFGLSGPEFKVLKTLLSKECAVEEVAARLGKDRTTIQRSVKRLVQKGLVKRKQYNLENGGYQYYYSAQGKEQIKSRIQDHFETFTNMVRKEIESW